MKNIYRIWGIRAKNLKYIELRITIVKFPILNLVEYLIGARANVTKAYLVKNIIKLHKMFFCLNFGGWRPPREKHKKRVDTVVVIGEE